MLNLSANRYSSVYRQNSDGNYRGVKYELQHMGRMWRLRSSVGQFFGDTSEEAMTQFQRVVDQGG